MTKMMFEKCPCCLSVGGPLEPLYDKVMVEYDGPRDRLYWNCLQCGFQVHSVVQVWKLQKLMTRKIWWLDFHKRLSLYSTLMLWVACPFIVFANDYWSLFATGFAYSAIGMWSIAKLYLRTQRRRMWG